MLVLGLQLVLELVLELLLADAPVEVADLVLPLVRPP